MVERKRSCGLCLVSCPRGGYIYYKNPNTDTIYKAPSCPDTIDIPSSSNILSTSVVEYDHPSGEEADEGASATQCSIVVTGADKRLSFMGVSGEHEVTASLTSISESPILSVVSLRDELGRQCLAMTNMSGKLIMMHGSEILDSRQDHTKYAIQVVSYDDGNDSSESNGKRQPWIVTAGWDGMVFIYRLGTTASEIGEPLDSIKLPTSPECIRLIRNQDTNDLILLVSRRDSTNLYYYLVEPGNSDGSNSMRNTSTYKCQYLGKQNLAPHANAWVSFSPSSFAICPHDPQIVAIATSILPHMKVMIVKLLIPSAPPLSSSSSREPTQDQHETQARQALAELAIQNREDAAILINANTMAPQTAYSTPMVVWRPDGSGVWVNGDDGVIRGVEANTGKVVATLSNGHEPGSKVRSIWAGWVATGEREESGLEEWLVSGGFDKKLLVWKIQQS